MQHWILRCKHCQKEYVYCTYGNGPEYGTEVGCSREYCAECQKAIDNALSQIPVKFKEELIEIEYTDQLKTIFDKIKGENIADEWSNLTVCSADPKNYDVTEVFQYNNKKYELKWNDDTPNDKHLFVVKEHDILNNKTTDKFWRFSGKDYYSKHRNLMKMLTTTLELCEVREMEKPVGKKFLFEPFEPWEISTKHKEK